ncbi:MAG: hypothetical protein QF404_14315 [Planctomycetota bacterium]|nr:hypothetical protein [Planctomycetota bacterium]MDP6938725.1 hypothetical protein [Planctomycetota bacterium]
MATKHCFMNKDRVCDLTCKAAFAVDDPMDPVDCYFIWLSAHLGEGLFDLRRLVDIQAGFSGSTPPPASEGGTPPPGGHGKPPPSSN